MSVCCSLLVWRWVARHAKLAFMTSAQAMSSPRLTRQQLQQQVQGQQAATAEQQQGQQEAAVAPEGSLCAEQCLPASAHRVSLQEAQGTWREARDSTCCMQHLCSALCIALCRQPCLVCHMTLVIVMKLSC